MLVVKDVIILTLARLDIAIYNTRVGALFLIAATFHIEDLNLIAFQFQSHSVIALPFVHIGGSMCMSETACFSAEAQLLPYGKNAGDSDSTVAIATGDSDYSIQGRQLITLCNLCTHMYSHKIIGDGD